MPRITRVCSTQKNVENVFKNEPNALQSKKEIAM